MSCLSPNHDYSALIIEMAKIRSVLQIAVIACTLSLSESMDEEWYQSMRNTCTVHMYNKNPKHIKRKENVMENGSAT